MISAQTARKNQASPAVAVAPRYRIAVLPNRIAGVERYKNAAISETCQSDNPF